MKAIFYAPLFLFTFNAAFAQPVFKRDINKDTSFVQVLTLEQAIGISLQNNNELQSAAENISIARERSREAIFRFFPQFRLTGSVSKTNTTYPIVLTPEFGSHLILPGDNENFYAGRISVVQPIYKGGENINLLEIAKTSLKQSQAEYDAIKRKTVLATKIAFYELLLSKEMLSSSQGWEEKINAMLKSGKLSGWDRITASSERDTFLFEQQQKVYLFNQKKLEFLSAINKELRSDIEIAGELKVMPVNITIEKAIVWSMEYRPELEGEIYKAQMDAIGVNLASSRQMPEILLGASYDIVGSHFPLSSGNWEATLVLSLPLSYDFWTQLSQKKSRQRQGDLKRSATQDTVRKQVRSSYEKLMFWQTESEKRRTAYMSLKNAYDEAFNKGDYSLSSVQASLAVHRSHILWLESVKNQLVAKAEIEWAIGRDLNPA